MTPHNTAKKNEIAKVVLMPGDPLRAKWIAENFLSKSKLVNSIRGMYAYTGFYKNKKITIMGHGMGIPSIGIYSYELFKFYNVDTIIRIGSCGSYSKLANLGDVIIAEAAYSDSNYAKQIGLNVSHVLKATPKTLKYVLSIANKLKIKILVCQVNSEDAFYRSDMNWRKVAKITKSLVTEMEAYGLYANALKTKKNALTILTVSDSLIKHERMEPEKRQKSFNKMVTLALESAIGV